MTEEKITIIKRSVRQSGLILFCLWLLIFFIPICVSVIALEFFVEEYADFTEPERISDAFTRLNDYRNAMTITNHLNDCRSAWKSILSHGSVNKFSAENLKTRIDEQAGAESIIFIPFLRNGKFRTALTKKPDDLKNITFPPAPLFRKQIDYLTGSNSYSTGVLTERDEAEKRRNSMTMQQIFMTVTPVTISPEQTSKNFSVKYGGELYFSFLKLEDSQDSQSFSGFLIIFRGRDFNLKNHIQKLNRRFPGCKTVLQNVDLQMSVKNPASFNSGIQIKDSVKKLQIPADQVFVRTFLMNGGIHSINNPGMYIPFLEYDLSASESKIKFFARQRSFKALAVALAFFSAVIFLHQFFFGSLFHKSFKRRILFTALIAAFFPFSSFAACFYLHSQFERHLTRVNLINEINLMLTQNNSALNQYVSSIEVFLAQAASLLSASKKRSKNDLLLFLQELGKNIPVSHLRIFTPEEIIDVPYPERISDMLQGKEMNVVANFMPSRALELLRDPQPVKREPQNSVVIAGQIVKTSSISESLISDGEMFPVDLTRYKNWFSTAKIFSSADSIKVDALLLSAFESGPILKEVLRKTQIGKNDYVLNYDKFKIRFAFLPVKQTGVKSVWDGEGMIDDPLFAALREGKTETSVKIFRDENEIEKLLITRLNNGIPHLAAALTDLTEQSGSSFLTIPALGFCLYILSLFYFVNKLFSRFLVDPVSLITQSAELIARGHDNWESRLVSDDEFGALNNSFAQLVVGLKQRNILKSYLSSDALQEIENIGTTSLAPGGEYMQASIVFVSAATENSDDDVMKIIELLNTFIDLTESVVEKHNGTIDKIIDSTLMIVFRQSGEANNHALDAVSAVLQIKKKIKEETERGIHAGISSGKVISGRIGSYAGKLDFTVIGDPVNLAARLKKESTDSNTGIIVSGATMRLLKGKARISFLRRCEIKGKSREFNIYELLDLRE